MISEPRRPISKQEEATLLEALRVATVFPITSDIETTVHRLEVVAHCECGCASVDFSGNLGDDEKAVVIADAMGKTKKGGTVGFMVWCTKGKPTSLEVFSIGSHDSDNGLPLPETIRKFKSGNDKAI